MTIITELDYDHANERGNGPKNRMAGGDLTDDIEINDPDSPLKKKRKPREQESSIEELTYTKPKT